MRNVCISAIVILLGAELDAEMNELIAKRSETLVELARHYLPDLKPETIQGSFVEVRAELLKLAPPRKDIQKTFAFTGPASAPRTVIVERKPSRRVIPAAAARASLR